MFDDSSIDGFFCHLASSHRQPVDELASSLQISAFDIRYSAFKAGKQNGSPTTILQHTQAG